MWPASLASHQTQRKNAMLRGSLKTVTWMRYLAFIKAKLYSATEFAILNLPKPAR